MLQRVLPPARPLGWMVLLVLALGCSNQKAAEDAYRQVQEKAQQQATTIAGLREMGAKIEQKAYPRGGKAWTVDLSGMQLPEDIFQTLKQIAPITELNLSNTNVTDAQMDSVNQPEIGGVVLKLNLSNTAVTDAGLEKLTHLYALQELILTGSQVTAAGVEQFRQARAADRAIPQRFRSPSIQL